MADHAQLRAFEAQLDNELKSCRTARSTSLITVPVALGTMEVAAHENPAMFSRIEAGFDVLVKRWASGTDSNEVTVDQLLRDLILGSHYFHLREFLYFGYNAPSSVSWEFSGNEVFVSYADESLPRQFFLQANNFFVDSFEVFRDYDGRTDEITSLLVGGEEFSLSTETQRAFELISEETDLKLTTYFGFLDDDTPLSNYTFDEFKRVYRDLMTKALYHRYWARANDTIKGAIEMPIVALIDGLQSDGHRPDILRSVIRDLAYGLESIRTEPMHYPLIYTRESDSVHMSPARFALHEGYISALRICATREPEHYLRVISPVVSANFVDHVASLFESVGFRCAKNVSVRRFDESAPDIDVLAISEELTLGYVVFFCEVKAPIPASWSKEHLRALEADNIAKSFAQVARLQALWDKPEGVEFIRNQLPATGLPHFGGEFVVACHHLVVTSWNAGMFFADEHTLAIDHRTLGRALRRSDGDVVSLVDFLKACRVHSKEHYELVTETCQIGELSVSYEGVSLKSFLDFGQAEFRSIGLDKKIAREFILAGGHPHDVFRERKVDDE